ncbi:GntR family transcriptional regulator [Candidatus Symbiopectobacterium endolongispinus]|uniref:GntR family transcriptional regulator n=1 Tax=Candidatus Symbiopectobacterium endolongispinus TaxID=2812664 RepID=UPI00207A4CBC|nr:GntR family transcriptional regulator [Candidatus Symbiopectobacterium endolongispinus]MBT9430150.1 GntR family transcriptional regulator [Candidatus Symbiopectobacterium endolongispinus]
MDQTDAANLANPAPLPAVVVDRRPLTDRVADYVRDLIVQDILQPGDPINVQSICSTLQISQTPLREALKMLAAQGLVDLRPNKRVVVASLAANEIEDMLVVYTEMEKLAGRLAALQATPDDLHALQQEQALMAAFHAGELLRYFHANQAFHQALVHASHNATLIELRNNLNAVCIALVSKEISGMRAAVTGSVWLKSTVKFCAPLRRATAICARNCWLATRTVRVPPCTRTDRVSLPR